MHPAPESPQYSLGFGDSDKSMDFNLMIRMYLYLYLINIGKYANSNYLMNYNKSLIIIIIGYDIYKRRINNYGIIRSR